MPASIISFQSTIAGLGGLSEAFLDTATALRGGVQDEVWIELRWSGRRWRTDWEAWALTTRVLMLAQAEESCPKFILAVIAFR